MEDHKTKSYVNIVSIFMVIKNCKTLLTKATKQHVSFFFGGGGIVAKEKNIKNTLN